MSQNFIDILAILSLLLITLVQIAGIVVAAILLRRKAGAGATLALIGFGVLLLISVCGQLYSMFIFPSILHSATLGALTAAEVLYTCSHGLIMTIGFGLLVFGIWKLGQKATPKETETTEVPEIEA